VRRTVSGVYSPVRSVPLGRGMAYVEMHRVPWAPSAPGRRLVDVTGRRAPGAPPTIRWRTGIRLSAAAYKTRQERHLTAR
jgi:hypothetical protein